MIPGQKVQVRTPGVLLLLGLVGSLWWYKFPVGPTWGLLTVLTVWLLLVLMSLVGDWVVAILEVREVSDGSA